MNSSTDLNGLRKSRWKSTYTIPGETGNAIYLYSCQGSKTENSTYGIVITGTADGGYKSSYDCDNLNDYEMKKQDDYDDDFD
ncbi:unnamed protein product [Rhizophagus irregularis]|nr:unnamed protein product [Rhizophagus irregularis]